MLSEAVRNNPEIGTVAFEMEWGKGLDRILDVVETRLSAVELVISWAGDECLWQLWLYRLYLALDHAVGQASPVGARANRALARKAATYLWSRRACNALSSCGSTLASEA